MNEVTLNLIIYHAPRDKSEKVHTPLRHKRWGFHMAGGCGGGEETRVQVGWGRGEGTQTLWNCSRIRVWVTVGGWKGPRRGPFHPERSSDLAEWRGARSGECSNHLHKTMVLWIFAQCVASLRHIPNHNIPIMVFKMTSWSLGFYTSGVSINICYAYVYRNPFVNKMASKPYHNIMLWHRHNIIVTPTCHAIMT